MALRGKKKSHSRSFHAGTTTAFSIFLEPPSSPSSSTYIILAVLSITAESTHITEPYSRNSNKFSDKSLHKAMDLRLIGVDSPFLSTLHHLLDSTAELEKSQSAPTRAYFQDYKAMATTPADIKEYPNSYVFTVDMPGMKSGDINVQVEDNNMLIISGERKREEEEKEGIKYLKVERSMGKLMRKFLLPDNANTDSISAVSKDGVLTVTVQKLPPPEPKKPRTIDVKIA